MKTTALWPLVAVFVLTSCGATSEPPISAAPSAPTPGASTNAGDDGLTISVRDAAGTATTWRLTCDPPGGTHPDPATACRALDRNGATALPPVPKDRMCTEVYGGPERATISGTWRGQPVISELSRVNGCEISRWTALEGLLPKAGA